jgi:hypothetical protein
LAFASLAFASLAAAGGTGAAAVVGGVDRPATDIWAWQIVPFSRNCAGSVVASR